MTAQTKQQKGGTVRPPVIAVMGHIDHGKSTLLDYIRKTESVAEEAGGITQHIAAYEVAHPDESGATRRITFLDTPGHEAFSALRSRGATIADIAILVVAADDGVMEQTLEALKTIKESGLPYVVAITKIDKENADVERTKQNLAEHEVYLEGYGGEVSFVPLSAKSGKGVPDLLDILLLTADVEELTGDPSAPAEGVVIEADVDAKRGISATLIIKNGTLARGQFVVAGAAFAPVRILEDYAGNTIDEASFSSPVTLYGFSDVPVVGSPFTTHETKKDAERAAVEEAPEAETEAAPAALTDTAITIPIIIKADVLGSLDGIEHELNKLESERVHLRVIQRSIGTISENDIRYAIGKGDTIVLGFNTGIDTRAKELAERFEVTVAQFDIIYELAEWMEKEVAKRTPKMETEEAQGRMRVLKVFSKTKNKHVIGGRVESGTMRVGEQIRVLRRGNEITRGKILNIQKHKAEVTHIESGDECGMQVEANVDIAAGDEIESFIVTEK